MILWSKDGLPPSQPVVRPKTIYWPYFVICLEFFALFHCVIRARCFGLLFHLLYSIRMWQQTLLSFLLMFPLCQTSYMENIRTKAKPWKKPKSNMRSQIPIQNMKQNHCISQVPTFTNLLFSILCSFLTRFWVKSITVS